MTGRAVVHELEVAFDRSWLRQLLVLLVIIKLTGIILVLVLSIPMYPELTDEQIDRVTGAIRGFVKAH